MLVHGNIGGTAEGIKRSFVLQEMILRPKNAFFVV